MSAWTLFFVSVLPQSPLLTMMMTRLSLSFFSYVFVEARPVLLLQMLVAEMVEEGVVLVYFLRLVVFLAFWVGLSAAARLRASALLSIPLSFNKYNIFNRLVASK